MLTSSGLAFPDGARKIGERVSRVNRRLISCGSFVATGSGGTVSARAWLWLFLVVLIGGVAGAGWLRCEGTPPVVETTLPIRIGVDARSVTLRLSDPGSGVRSAEATLVHAGGETPLAGQQFTGDLLLGGDRSAPETFEVSVDPKALGLKEGSASLRVVTRDWAWRDLLRGNESRVELEVVVDRRPPQIAIENGLTYLRKGGSGAVVYRVNEETLRDGVVVGELFFRGYPIGGEPPAVGSDEPPPVGAAAPAPAEEGARPAGRRIAVFALPHDMDVGAPIRVEAVDRVGNRTQTSWATNLKDHAFPDAQIVLSQQFLSRKVPELSAEAGFDATDLVAGFQRINSELRAANEARVREIIRRTASEPHWKGGFLQLANSEVTSRFAERRSYFLDGQRISQATHFGYDLAALAQTPITASNAGVVLFSGALGIYGNCVVLDHGLGVTSLYAHLSSLDVAEGDFVERGQVLGLSGDTGLAGGDHLHFAILVGDVYVDPVEWWDAKWVREHVDALFRP
jgi:murein DD-endopeptidase MepM/ murein hydrolase activator NlpD